jgi:hypothetical protein
MSTLATAADDFRIFHQENTNQTSGVQSQSIAFFTVFRRAVTVNRIFYCFLPICSRSICNLHTMTEEKPIECKDSIFRDRHEAHNRDTWGQGAQQT